MRKVLVGVGVLFLAVAFAAPVGAQCAKIKDGSITAVSGAPLQLGFDQWGYNYQAHLFNGLTDNFTRPAVPVTEGSETLVMKWSDDWLANVDCDNDHKLDRGYDAKTGIITGTSQGWVTNHFEGDYIGSDGESHHYTYFAKIVFVGAPAIPDPWADVRIWGLYAIIEELQNDPYGELGTMVPGYYDGKYRNKLGAPGLGQF